MEKRLNTIRTKVENKMPENTTHLNMDFYPHYLSGRRITVSIPMVGEKTGKVGMSQEKVPCFWLVTSGGQYPLMKGPIFLGVAQRKTRIDCALYLQGKVPTYHNEGGRDGEQGSSSGGDRKEGGIHSGPREGLRTKCIRKNRDCSDNGRG